MAALLAIAAAPGAAQASAYVPGFYAGHTSQGKTISFMAAAGQVSGLRSEILDSCHPGSLHEFLYPHATAIDRHGNWFHRTAGSQPTVFRGHLDGHGASGSIDDTTDTSSGRRCHGHVTFHAARSNPLRVGPATVGGRGTDVQLRLGVAAVFNGAEVVPDTDAALLVYGSNTGCPGTYQAADALARSESGGSLGLISDAYVTADYGFAPSKRYAHGVFTFDVTTNTLLPTASGGSPFSTVCVMLYSGRPGTLNPARNVALATTQGPLVPGPGAPTNQP